MTNSTHTHRWLMIKNQTLGNLSPYLAHTLSSAITKLKHRDVKLSVLHRSCTKSRFTLLNLLHTSDFRFYLLWRAFYMLSKITIISVTVLPLKCTLPSSTTIIFNKMFTICLKPVITSVWHPLEWSKFKKG